MNARNIGLSEVLVTVGAAMVTVSLWAIYPPAAGLTLGALLVTGGILRARAGM